MKLAGDKCAERLRRELCAGGSPYLAVVPAASGLVVAHEYCGSFGPIRVSPSAFQLLGRRRVRQPTDHLGDVLFFADGSSAPVYRETVVPRRMGSEDKRIMPHFFRPTADGRILWGGRDAPFSAAGPNPRRDRDPYIFGRLEETFRWTFPQLGDVRVDQRWGGPVCGTVNCFASVGWLGRSERIAYALGYAGHGVGPSHLVGKVTRDLMLNRQTDLLDLPMVTKRPIPLPPGPLRSFFLNLSQHTLLEADDRGIDAGPLVKMALKALQ